MTRKTIKYISDKTFKRASLTQLFSGSLILAISGVVLFSLPAKLFYFVFLLGFYLFFTGAIIVLQVVAKSTAKRHQAILLPLARFFKDSN